MPALKSGITFMRTRPEARPRLSTATRTRAARRCLSWRLPCSPACSPPTHVSSISTSPCRDSRGRYSTLVRGYQIRRPKPVGQRNLGPVKDGPGCDRNLVTTLGALATALIHKFVRLLVPASRTSEPLRPTAETQILLARLFGGELGLKFPQGSWKGRTRHLSTLQVVVC